MTYRAFLTDLLSGVKLAHSVPIAVKEYSRPLGGVPTLTGTISLDADVPEIQEARTVLWLDDGNGRIEWAGIIWNAVPDIAARELNVSASGFLSYLSHREIRRTLKYDQADELDIARSLIAYPQLHPAGRIGLAAEPWRSGTLRDREYPGEARKPVWEALSQLSQVDGGFDFFEDWGYDPDTGRPAAVVRFLDPDASPDRVRRDVRLVYDDRPDSIPGTLTNYTWPTAGPDRINDIICSGAGEGSAKLLSQAVNDAELAAGWPLLEGSEMYPDITVQATLDEHAVEDLRARSGNVAVSELTIAPIGPRAGADLLPGDLVPVRLTSSYHRSPGAGLPGWSGWMRITALKVTPAHAGQDYQVTVTAEHTQENRDG